MGLLASVMLVLLDYTTAAKKAASRLAFFTKTYSLYFFILISFSVLMNGNSIHTILTDRLRFITL